MKRLTHTNGAKACRRKFLQYFKQGFWDETYIEWERGYKETAHLRWLEVLNRDKLESLLRRHRYVEIARLAVQIESRTNLLFSFEKMAFRDAVRSLAGAKLFATALNRFLYGSGTMEQRFGQWCSAIAGLPRRQTRVLTWPVVTIWGFLAQPALHIFLKPTVTRRAAMQYGYDFQYQPGPNWTTYKSALNFADSVLTENRDLKPRDMIDAQSFIWVQGSDEYPA
jgi:hypothetical protein